MWCRFLAACVAAFLICDSPASAQTQTPVQSSSLAGEPIRIVRARGRIAIDGDLGDEGWRDATRVTTWYETQPGDNNEPKVRNVGYLAFDDRYLYAGFDFEDPNPRAIKAPLGDRDNVRGFTDYGGIILDTRNDGRTAQMFLANARGIQYDAITDDASGEDSSPDFFWDSAARITERGWTLEIRVPFSSLRYKNVDPQTWGILLYRNHPREFRYQYFSAKIPRGSTCFICRSNPLVGLEHLPSGGHVVVAPYATASESAAPENGLGSRLVNGDVKPHAGLDVKYTPNADNAIDFTIKPDFSQVESDTAQISANERFALFYPEKRPFFLEGVNLLSTPMQAVYTRTITQPRWGARATGKQGGVQYTVLAAEDGGGGSVILPGANGSDLAPQDFRSRVFVGRARRDVGRSFVSVLATARDADTNGHNVVVGPDFEWRPSNSEVFQGQWLFSDTRTPNRPDLSSAWDGRSLTSGAATVNWFHSTKHLDLYGGYRDVGADFRADTGFMPQVGYRDANGGGGWTFRPTGIVRRLRTFFSYDRQADRDGALISRNIVPGLGMDTRLNGFLQFRYIDDRVRSGQAIFARRQFGYIIVFSPTRRLAQISADGRIGRDVDFANARPAHGSSINVRANLNPTDHLELTLLDSTRRLSVDPGAGPNRRLFTARVSRARGTYTFTARSFVRLIAQYVSTTRDPSLYTFTTSPKSASFSSSVLLAYKLNWQSVLFFGYGDDRELSQLDRLEPASRQFFVKISYALQR